MKLRELDDNELAAQPEGARENWIETDFFEYYWAHLMFGARWRHLIFWTVRVLRRGWKAASTEKGDNHHNARVLSARDWMVSSLVAVMLIAEVIASTALITGSSLLAIVVSGLVLVVLVALVSWLSDSLPLRVVGDVSRYLDVAPRNIARRHDILQGGIELLQSLHGERSDLAPLDEHGNAPYVYDRIVVVGHSLGSVIGYELIKHYWARVNRYLGVTEDGIKEIEEESESKGLDAKGYQELQDQLWRELGRSRDGESGQHPQAFAAPRWLVTDFVTLGSPLTYGAILLADSADDFSSKTEKLRELPTCPPDRSHRDRDGGFAVHLRYEAAIPDDDPRLILHHAAPFALTRWTNFFYKWDPVGGPLGNVFGLFIRDVEVKLPRVPRHRHWRRRGFTGLRLHTKYWPGFPDHIPELIEILNRRSDGSAADHAVGAAS